MNINNKEKNSNNQNDEYSTYELSQKKETFSSDSDFLSSEIKSSIPETFKRNRTYKRNKNRRLPFVTILIVVFTLGFIIYAVYWEREKLKAESEQMASQEIEEIELPPDYPPPGRSAVQDKLNELSWVEQDFLPLNQFSRPGTFLDGVNGLVIHNIGNPNTTAKQNRNYFASLAQTAERHASSTFIICLDGSVLQCVPVDEVAYASNQRNFDTLSIEFCHPDETGEPTIETLDALVRLSAWLCVEFELITDDIIRHYDIVRSDDSQKPCPLFFVDNENEWEDFKTAVFFKIQEMKAG